VSRYDKYRILDNASKYYEPIRKGRGAKIIRHYETPYLFNPGPDIRAVVASTTHIWKYGDRLYKLADQYYGDVRLWWVIAWYNGLPTEADLFPTDVIEIPLNIEEAMQALGVD
jgi:nucleoid-associated protein YgaU